LGNIIPAGVAEARNFFALLYEAVSGVTVAAVASAMDLIKYLKS
jgi:hypothetical protein